MKKLLWATAFCVALLPGAASAQYTDSSIRIGVLADMSGVVADIQGVGDVVAARMAIADHGGAIRGPWDLLEVIRTIPAEAAFRPLAQSDCPLVRR